MAHTTSTAVGVLPTGVLSDRYVVRYLGSDHEWHDSDGQEDHGYAYTEAGNHLAVLKAAGFRACMVRRTDTFVEGDTE